MSQIKVRRLPRLYLSPEYGPEVIAEGTRAGLAAVGTMAVGQVRTRIMDSRPRAPQDTGLMRQGIGFEVASDGKSVLVGPSPATSTRTQIMEEGRRPGARRPPLDPIFRWVQRKGLVSRFFDEGTRRAATAARKGAKGRSGVPLKATRKASDRDLALGVAFQIVRSIARKGIKARRFFRRAVPAVRTQAPEMVAHGIRMAFLRKKGIA